VLLTGYFCVVNRVVFDGKKVKAIPLQAWTGLEVSRSLKIPDLRKSACEGGKAVIPTNRPPLPQ
jgi:hypothetical protein